MGVNRAEGASSEVAERCRTNTGKGRDNKHRDNAMRGTIQWTRRRRRRRGTCPQWRDRRWRKSSHGSLQL